MQGTSDFDTGGPPRRYAAHRPGLCRPRSRRRGLGDLGGAAPQPFSAQICNGSDSRYSDLAVSLNLARGTLDGPFGPMSASDIVLLRPGAGGEGEPVPVEDDPDGAPFALNAQGDPFELSGSETVGFDFALGFAGGTEPGPAVIFGFLHTSDFSTFFCGDTAPFCIDGEQYEITAPAPAPGPAPELPDTGGSPTVGLAGGGLLLAGLFALLAVRRRRTA